MVTTLYLIRHGETESADEKRYKGSIDVAISLKGLMQIKKTSTFIKALLNGSNMRLKAVYTSSLQRALKSAEIIATGNALKPIVVPELRERNFGAWEGMSFDEIRASYPDAFDSWAKDPMRFSPIGGESTLEVKERVMKVLYEILKAHNGDAVSIVSHGGVNRVILCCLMGIPLENIFSIEQDYASVNIIEFYDGVPVVKLLNGVLYG
ncbi:MAG: histidine phosphatase family protein [Nitrospirae bacterium]|nr:histidine phosphatase family protein [Nitrospirota bacterium]